MELYKEILVELFGDSELGKIRLQQVVENRSYRALEQILQIIRTPEYDDPECFQRIEKIVTAFEKAGIDCGTRHDF